VTYEVTGPFLPTPAVPLLGSFGQMILVTALGTASALGLRGREKS
jgi:hypothetical protein